MQTRVEELEELNQSLINHDKMIDDAKIRSDLWF